jgi:tetratricopeptide (TPR) repeat protein
MAQPYPPDSLAEPPLLRVLSRWLVVGLLVGFVICFFRANKRAVLESRGAEAIFENAAREYAANGPRFGSEDHLSLLLADLNRACDAAQPGQRMEERVGDWLMTEGLQVEAGEYYVRALTRKPSVLLAMKTSAAGGIAADDDVVTQACRVWMQLRPNDPQPYNQLGYYYAVQGIQLDEAERLVGRALELVPAGAKFRGARAMIEDSLAWVYYRQQRYGEAAEVMQRVTEVISVAHEPYIREHALAIQRALGGGGPQPPAAGGAPRGSGS